MQAAVRVKKPHSGSKRFRSWKDWQPFNWRPTLSCITRLLGGKQERNVGSQRSRSRSCPKLAPEQNIALPCPSSLFNTTQTTIKQSTRFSYLCKSHRGQTYDALDSNSQILYVSFFGDALFCSHGPCTKLAFYRYQLSRLSAPVEEQSSGRGPYSISI